MTSLFALLVIGMAIAQTPPLPLRVSMISLGVKDPARSIKFYGETLGLQMIGKPSEVTLFRAGDIMLVLNQPAARAVSVQDIEVIFPVESVAASHKILLQRGCSFAVAPHEVTTGTWAATFTDPDGHLLTLFGPQ